MSVIGGSYRLLSVHNVFTEKSGGYRIVSDTLV